MPRNPGDRIDRFEILGLLGAGGCGEVYKASNEAGDVVALKVLTSTSPAVIAHFERELDATPEHTHIRRVRRKGDAEDGTRWLEMDYLDGDSLRDRMSRGALAWRDVLAVGTQTCAALQAAHERGVVHRDLKPDNIFVGAPPGVNVRVVDFSIALLQDAERLTRTGMILGTFQYMSPEQVRGDRRLDARSDIWSLGAVLYECVTGRCPFLSPTLAGLVYGIAFQELEPVTRLRPETPPRLAEAIHRALSKDPADRYPTAQAFCEALAGVRAPDEALAAPAPLRGAAITQAEDAASERALMSMVFLKGITDPGRLAEVAAAYGGELVPFADGKAIARLGGASLRGDEPERAVRLACEALPYVEGAGVATGWTLTPDRVEGCDLASRAERLASADGVAADVTTAGAVRERFTFAVQPDGRALLTAGQAAALASGVPAAMLSEPAPEGVDFFGRDALVRDLVACAAATAHEGFSLAVVLGDAGMGKSRLMQEALLRVRREEPAATVLTCRCTSYRQDIALGAWQELLAGVADLDLRALTRDASVTPEVLFDRVTAAVEPVVRALSLRGPLVVAVDDAHWIDALSARLIEWIAEYATEVPLAAWLAGRPDRWAAAFQATTGARTLTVGPLDEADARRVLVGAIGEAPPSLVARAGGNPLFLRELARLHAQRDEVPGADDANLVDLVFGARLARLEPARRDFARRSAVVGRVAWVEAVQAMGGDAAAWRKLLADRVFQRHPRSSIEGAQEFSFASELMTEVAYRMWPASTLPPMHEAVARWLDARPDASPGEVGRHWERAGRPEEAAAAFARAAEAAARAGDAERAVESAGRALRLSSDPEVQWRALAAQDAVFQLYADKDQQALQERGLEQMRRLSLELSLGRAVEVAWRQCYFYRITGDRDLALAFGEEALALAPALGDAAEESRWLSAVRNELALLHADAGAFEEALGHATEARQHASRLDDPWWLARTCFSEAYVIIELGRIEEALALFESAAAGYAAGGDRRREAIARMNGGYALLRLGRFDDAERHFDDAVALSRKVGNRRTVAVTLQNRCTLLRARGDLAAAAAALDEAARAAERLRFGRLETAVVLERAWLALAAQASAPEAAALARSATAEAERSGSPALIAQALAAELMAARRAGRREASLEVRARAQLAAAAPTSEEDVAVAAALLLLTESAEDEAAARGRLGAFLAAAVRAGDVGACVEGFALRYGLPAALVRRLAG